VKEGGERKGGKESGKKRADEESRRDGHISDP
jgi:hypothetical protein